MFKYLSESVFDYISKVFFLRVISDAVGFPLAQKRSPSNQSTIQ